MDNQETLQTYPVSAPATVAIQGVPQNTIPDQNAQIQESEFQEHFWKWRKSWESGLGSLAEKQLG